ncbi:hypothetical protein BJY04DRAFT_197023 [Aspergillus karnatakaensis]|uniref:uncharacterized protein n=1 Tax=Aspergillus karnatakaensis TaxID=1810916 RepID=UPI003CCDDCE2
MSETKAADFHARFRVFFESEHTPNVKLADMQVALEQTIRRHLPTMVEFLLKIPVDGTSRTLRDECSPDLLLKASALLGDTETMKSVLPLQTPQDNRPDKHCPWIIHLGATTKALFTAIRAGNPVAVGILCEYVPDFDVQNRADRTPLLEALHVGNEDAARLLIPRTSEVFHVGRDEHLQDGSCPLELAVKLRSQELFNLLVQQMNTVVSRDGQGACKRVSISHSPQVRWDCEPLQKSNATKFRHCPHPGNQGRGPGDGPIGPAASAEI